MRTTIVICTLLLLGSCKQQRTFGPFEQHIFTSSDNGSPIVVADGSVHVQTLDGDHVHVHGPRKASIKKTYYQPANIGFQCDPTTGATSMPCPATNCSTNNSMQCFVNPGSSAWALTLCESATTPCPAGSAVATLTWDPTVDAEKVAIEFQGVDYKIGNPSTGGVELFENSGSALQTATLTVGGTAYSFTCKAGTSSSPLPCLEIAYACSVTGDAKCK